MLAAEMSELAIDSPSPIAAMAHRLGKQLCQKNSEDVQMNSQTPAARLRMDNPTQIQSTFGIDIGLKSEGVAVTCITGSGQCCMKELHELQPILLEQMQVPIVHTGRLLACRIRTEAIELIGCEMFVEDINGDVEKLGLCYFNAERNKLKPGTIMLIKEPYLKYGSTSQRPFLFVESPSDVVFVPETSRDLLELAGAMCWFRPEHLSFDELKKAGNALLTKKDYDGALAYYERALALNPSESNAKLIRRNMAAALLELERFYEAYEQAKQGLVEAQNEYRLKAMFRMGKALYGMRRWQEAVNQFQSLLSEFPKSSLGPEELKRSKARLNESLTGRYDLRSQYHEQVNRGKHFFDLADYIGPVKVDTVTGKGNGLIVTKSVPKGTLLFACKAYAMSVYGDEVEDNAKFWYYDSISNEWYWNSQFGCITKTIQKLKRNPHTGSELYRLYDRDDEKVEGRGEDIPPGVIDIGRIERIWSLNIFKSTYEFLPAAPDEGDEWCQSMRSSFGLWLLPSFINHSCLGNVDRTFYGDMMYAYALDNLNERDELTWSYTSKQFYMERKAMFNKWEFKCDCRLCALDAIDLDGEQERGRLLQIIEAFEPIAMKEPNDKHLERCKELVEKMRHSYKDRTEFRVHLIRPLKLLAKLYMMAQDDRQSAVLALKECIEALGPNSTGKYHVNAGSLHFMLGRVYLTGYERPNVQMAKKAFNDALAIAKVREGLDKGLLMEIYPEYAELQDHIKKAERDGGFRFIIDL